MGLTLKIWHPAAEDGFFLRLRRTSLPNRPFHNLKASHDVPELYKFRQSPDLEALKMWKGLSGKKDSDSNLFSHVQSANPLPAQWKIPELGDYNWTWGAGNIFDLQM